jgi:hypothetical protein
LINHFCESPLEEDFAYHLTKYLDTTISLIPQHEVSTICGTFRIDFVAQGPAGLIGFECDGKDFHERDRDEWRDAMILGTKSVDAIYRLRGSDIYYHIEDIIYIIARWNTELFSQRGLLNLQTLASDEAKNGIEEAPKSIAMVFYRDEEKSSQVEICIERRSLNSGSYKRQFWEAAYRFACEVGGGKLEEVMTQYRAKKKAEMKDSNGLD